MPVVENLLLGVQQAIYEQKAKKIKTKNKNKTYEKDKSHSIAR